MTGERGAAFFDVDETLITVKSMFAFQRFWLAENGDDGSEYARLIDEIKQRAAAGAPREEVNRHYYRAYRGVRADALAAAGRRWFEQFTAGGGAYYSEAVKTLRAHRDSGHVTVLLSGSFAAAIAPIAAAVGADHLIATTPLVDAAGVLTGEVDQPMIGAAKAAAVTEFLHRHAIARENSYGYGDHASDLPFLRAVGHPGYRGDDAVLAAHGFAWTHLGDRVGDSVDDPGRLLSDQEALAVW
ncbi:HAD-IB family hydrolase [Nocardia yunnanensis]|uniref:HAD-IB family hydrolase n=1 Tax=Nocardia yunnanensis TaxID=2382165 RepID=A0A386ZNY3_9NOCA|nr:HAD-IB family hydrolase [Nocardia yunnanensis]AYF78409.1 HAD-IB family hydrolase [Nocardia yunnanensis]